MNMHKNTRLTPHHRQAIWLAYTQEKESVTSLARRYQVSRVTIYRALKAARAKLLKPQTSTNNRFKQAKYGMKRLAKVERGIQEKLKRQAKRYNKSYPGEPVHLDTKRLPLLKAKHGIKTFTHLTMVNGKLSANYLQVSVTVLPCLMTTKYCSSAVKQKAAKR